MRLFRFKSIAWLKGCGKLIFSGCLKYQFEVTSGLSGAEAGNDTPTLHNTPRGNIDGKHKNEHWLPTEIHEKDQFFLSFLFACLLWLGDVGGG